MSKLGSKDKPAVVRVQTQERALAILDLCKSRGWQVLIGLEGKEEICNLEKLLNPPKPTVSEKIDRNALCPCGSGKKSKKCCYIN